MKLSMEMGGFFPLENYGIPTYHKNPVLFNSARNALRYILQTYQIKEIFVPYYTCPVVFDSIKKESCTIHCYDIDKNFMPVFNPPKDSFVLYNDYFGLCTNNVPKLTRQYPKLIIDNAQSFFAPHKGLASFYSPRKFFGLPDGGIAITKKSSEMNFERDISHERILHLLKRPDLGAEAAYADFKKNELILDNLPIQKMSTLTQLLMGNINYKKVKSRRRKNFSFLHTHLKKYNELYIKNIYSAVPMVYPLLFKKNGLQEYLISHKIYIPKYWPGLTGIIPAGSFSEYLVENLVPLPIDQRYDRKDMEQLVEIVNAYD